MTSLLLQQIVFYVFAAIAVVCASMVVFSQHPVRSALFLVATFFASAAVWLLLQAEFLALILILVYVGAVMTLFLFVVMTLNIAPPSTRFNILRYLPFGLLVVALLVTLMVYVISPQHFLATAALAPASAPTSSNLVTLGGVLYTDYAYAFELAGTLLLAAIIAAIALTHRPTKQRKTVIPAQQISVEAQQRLKIIKMPPEQKS